MKDKTPIIGKPPKVCAVNGQVAGHVALRPNGVARAASHAEHDRNAARAAAPAVHDHTSAFAAHAEHDRNAVLAAAPAVHDHTSAFAAHAEHDRIAAIAAARAEHERWMAKYLPVEREILAARARRLDSAGRRRRQKARAFGDLCEATEGLAVVWRRDATPLSEQLAWADGDVWTLLCLARCNRFVATRRLDALRHAVKRPLYYEAENARRRKLAAERRAVRRRTTENPCPTREEILYAWTHRKDSHAATIRFGGLIEDLECHLDNALRFDDAGNIVGRNGGVKRWLQMEIPALYLKYTTVMRYKSAARKLRQIAGVADPFPATRIVEPDLDGSASNDDGGGVREASPSPELARIAETAQAEETAQAPAAADVPATAEVPAIAQNPDVARARAIWREVTEGVAANPTALMARLDALLDPDRIEDANMLAEWRERHEKEIAQRTRSR